MQGLQRASSPNEGKGNNAIIWNKYKVLNKRGSKSESNHLSAIKETYRRFSIFF